LCSFSSLLLLHSFRSVNCTQCFVWSHDDPVHGTAYESMLQERDWSPGLRGVGRRAVGNTMHGEDVAVCSGHCVGLRRVAVLNEWYWLDEQVLQDITSTVT
jgi:hypothetical protein